MTAQAPYRYASTRTVLLDVDSRAEKAEKIYLVLKDEYDGKLEEAKLLDLGCSAGLMAGWLAQHVNEVHGIDIDEDVREPIKQVEGLRPNFHFHFASADKLPISFSRSQFFATCGDFDRDRCLYVSA